MPKPVVHKVMLVDDDQAMQSTLRTFLELEGFSVAVGTGRASQEEIFRQIYTEQPDALLLDVRLGKINGLDLLRMLREEEGTRQTRILMTSGMPVGEQCLDAGADSFLLKPLLPDEILRALRS